MKSWLLLIALFSYVSLGWADGPTLTTGIKKTWTVEMARQEALANLLPQIDVSSFQPIDPRYEQTLKAIASRKLIMGNRTITLFDDQSYGVIEECAPLAFYYSSKGKLDSIEYPANTAPRCPVKYPEKRYKYSYPEGNLVDISLTVALGEDFLFLPDGTLVVHWKGARCFFKDGELCGSRYSYREKTVKVLK